MSGLGNVVDSCWPGEGGWLEAPVLHRSVPGLAWLSVTLHPGAQMWCRRCIDQSRLVVWKGLRIKYEAALA